MEINPIVFTADGKSGPLDLAAKIDETAALLNASQWGHLDLTAPFRRKEFPEEDYIRELDSKTGASLKLTILNLAGRVWTMLGYYPFGPELVYCTVLQFQIPHPFPISIGCGRRCKHSVFRHYFRS